MGSLLNFLSANFYWRNYAHWEELRINAWVLLWDEIWMNLKELIYDGNVSGMYFKMAFYKGLELLKYRYAIFCIWHNVTISRQTDGKSLLADLLYWTREILDWLDKNRTQDQVLITLNHTRSSISRKLSQCVIFVSRNTLTACQSIPRCCFFLLQNPRQFATTFRVITKFNDAIIDEMSVVINDVSDL